MKGWINLKKYNHIKLNNEVMQRKNGGMGFFNLEKDKEALDEYMREVNDYTIHFDSEMERLHYLIENNFYYNVFKQYAESIVQELIDYTNSFEFKFASYMAATKFYKDYALKTNDKKQYLENYHQHVLIVSLYLAKGDKEVAKQLISAMMEQRYQAATPTFMNAGKARRGELVSCFLLEESDSLNSINYNESVARQLLI
mgnify:CR=1 FL=1